MSETVSRLKAEVFGISNPGLRIAFSRKSRISRATACGACAVYHANSAMWISLRSLSLHYS
jgi:hypothetical protein